MNNSIKEALKEGARVVILAVVSYLLTVGVVDKLVLYFVKDTLSPEMITIVTGMIITVLRTIDKGLYVEGKETYNDTMKKGLTQF